MKISRVVHICALDSDNKQDAIRGYRNENRQHVYRALLVKDVLQSLILPLAYAGGSVFFREYLYKDNPRDNGYAYVNSAVACSLIGGFGGFITGYAIGSMIFQGNFLDRLDLIAPSLIGAGIGLAAGIVVGVTNEDVKDKFKNERIYYYSTPAALCIIVPAFTVRF